MSEPPAQLYLSQLVDGHSYGILIRRDVAEAARGRPIATEEEFIDWVDREMPRMIAAVDRRREAGQIVRGLWTELDADDFA